MKLPFEENVISIYNSDPITINLHSHQTDKSIKDSSQLVLKGHGYDTAETAQAAGEHSRDQLTVAFAMLRFPADFGDRAAKRHWTEYGLKILEGQIGQRVLNDFHGLQVYETRINPKFSTVTANATIAKSKEMALKAFEHTFSKPYKIPERKRLAFDLFSASSFTNYADARFMLLMMAIETLIEQKERTEEEQELIDQLIDNVRAYDIGTKDSIIGGLKNLKQESIGTAGKRLANILTDKYMDMTPGQFFTHCYSLRSKLVHGHTPRPTFEEIGSVSATLELFTADLIINS